MVRLAYSIPLAGHAVTDVQRESRFELAFNDKSKSRLWLEGPFRLHTGDDAGGLFEPPCPAWVRDVLLSFVGVKIISARFGRNSRLQLTFQDGRQLTVDDGPYENWHYSNADGLRIHGGVGRTS